MKAWEGDVVARMTTPKSKAGRLAESDVLAATADVTGKELGLMAKMGTGGRSEEGSVRTREENPHSQAQVTPFCRGKA